MFVVNWIYNMTISLKKARKRDWDGGCTSQPRSNTKRQEWSEAQYEKLTNKSHNEWWHMIANEDHMRNTRWHIDNKSWQKWSHICSTSKCETCKFMRQFVASWLLWSPGSFFHCIQGVVSSDHHIMYLIFYGY